MRALAAVLMLCAIASPAGAKPRRFAPPALYAGMFRLHHTWRYRFEIATRSPDAHGTRRGTMRCTVVAVHAAPDATMSEIACTGGPDDDGLWMYHLVPAGTWIADARGLSRPGGEPGDAIPAGDDRGPVLLDAKPTELSTAPDADGNPTHIEERRVGDRWCVPGEVGGSDEGPATQELCFGRSGVLETAVATGTAPEQLTFELAP